MKAPIHARRNSKHGNNRPSQVKRWTTHPTTKAGSHAAAGASLHAQDRCNHFSSSRAQRVLLQLHPAPLCNLPFPTRARTAAALCRIFSARQASDLPESADIAANYVRAVTTVLKSVHSKQNLRKISWNRFIVKEVLWEAISAWRPV